MEERTMDGYPNKAHLSTGPMNNGSGPYGNHVAAGTENLMRGSAAATTRATMPNSTSYPNSLSLRTAFSNHTNIRASLPNDNRRASEHSAPTKSWHGNE